jgi:hypothetical protein
MSRNSGEAVAVVVGLEYGVCLLAETFPTEYEFEN